jgi:hypothetical protein
MNTLENTPENTLENKVPPDHDIRESISTHSIKKGFASAVVAPAGSGKTTIAIDYARRTGARTLLCCYNKRFQEEADERARDDANITTSTLDAISYNSFFTRGVAYSLTRESINRTFVKSKFHTSWEHAAEIVGLFNAFCDDPDAVLEDACAEIRQIADDVMHKKYWDFGIIRKLVQLNGSAQRFLRSFDVIIIDEAQDLSPLFLRILLQVASETYMLFIGDPNQSLYEFNGCIDLFDPKVRETHGIEFDRIWRLKCSFRFGQSICNLVNGMSLTGAPLEPGADRITRIHNLSESVCESEFLTGPYIYLFRSWKELMITACKFPRAFVDIESQGFKGIRWQKSVDGETTTSQWVKKLKKGELDQMISKITTQHHRLKTDSNRITFLTVHAFKGKEDKTVRLHVDVMQEEDQRITYVGVTRAIERLVIPCLPGPVPRASRPEARPASRSRAKVSNKRAYDTHAAHPFFAPRRKL